MVQVLQPCAHSVPMVFCSCHDHQPASSQSAANQVCLSFPTFTHSTTVVEVRLYTLEATHGDWWNFCLYFTLGFVLGSKVKSVKSTQRTRFFFGHQDAYFYAKYDELLYTTKAIYFYVIFRPHD